MPLLSDKPSVFFVLSNKTIPVILCVSSFYPYFPLCPTLQFSFQLFYE
jgi:hypothetical protein